MWSGAAKKHRESVNMRFLDPNGTITTKPLYLSRNIAVEGELKTVTAREQGCLLLVFSRQDMEVIVMKYQQYDLSNKT